MNRPFSTLPGLVQHVNRTFRNPTAMAYKQDRTWISISTQEMADTIQKIGLGLLEIGLKPGDCVGIVADPSPFWMMFDFAVLGVGGVTVPLFSNVSPENLKYEIQDSAMRFLLVGTKAQYQALHSFCDGMERIIVHDKNLESERCISWDSLLAAGEHRMAAKPEEWEQLNHAVGEDALATLIYTSGSTGIPKGVELTHKNLITQVYATGIRFPIDFEKDKVLSCLPLAHVFERMAAFYYFSTGASLYFCGDVKKVAFDLREVHPTVITLVPRLFEKVFAKMQSNVEAATGFKKMLGRAAFERAQTKPYNTPKSLKDKLFDALVYGKMREALGGNLRLTISGGAPLDPALYQFFLNIGIPVYEGYGLTETSPVIAANFPGHSKVGTVGLPFPDMEVRIADDGEILARGSGVMKGYHNKPKETAEVIDVEGWLHTGDLGNIDIEGYLKITGRKKELFKTANGKYVAPVPIEQALTANHLADMAMVIAEKRPFTTALLFPDVENLKMVKTELGCEAMDNATFLHSEQAVAYLQKSVDQVNEKLNHWEKVQKFYLADHALTIDAGEITPTLKIRRHIVEEKFRGEIDAMYAGASTGSGTA